MSYPKTSTFGAPKRAEPLRLILPLAAAALAIASVLSAMPAPAVEAAPVADPPRHSIPAELGVPEVELPTLALPVVAVPVAPVVETVVEAPSEPVASSWDIGISAFGWQNELDACQWVLMDMVAEVPLPIVAAHNYCGGGIVLEMQLGDTVNLSGYGFDGTYVVTGSRDAWSGGNAAEAVSGMGGSVVLQTCYWDDDGTERLVSLERV